MILKVYVGTVTDNGSNRNVEKSRKGSFGTPGAFLLLQGLEFIQQLRRVLTIFVPRTVVWVLARPLYHASLP